MILRSASAMSVPAALAVTVSVCNSLSNFRNLSGCEMGHLLLRNLKNRGNQAGRGGRIVDDKMREDVAILQDVDPRPRQRPISRCDVNVEDGVSS